MKWFFSKIGDHIHAEAPDGTLYDVPDGNMDSHAGGVLLSAMSKALASLPDVAPVEPVAWMVRNGLVDYQLMGSKTQADALAAEMQKRHDLSGSRSSFRVHPLYASPSPPPPAEVPLLTDGEIAAAIVKADPDTSVDLDCVCRNIEQAVRQKAGLK